MTPISSCALLGKPIVRRGGRNAGSGFNSNRRIRPFDLYRVTVVPLKEEASMILDFRNLRAHAAAPAFLLSAFPVSPTCLGGNHRDYLRTLPRSQRRRPCYPCRP